MSRSHSYIGVDLGGPVVRAVQLMHGPAGRLRVGAWASFPAINRAGARAEDEFGRLAGALLRRGFVGEKLALCLPDDRLQTAVLQLPPPSSGAPLLDLARAELATLYKYDPALIQVAMWVLPAMARQGSGPAQCLALAALHEQTDSLSAAAASAGLSVYSIEPRPAMLARAASMQKPAGDGVGLSDSATVIVHIGQSHAQLIVARGTQLLHHTPMEGCETAGIALPARKALRIDSQQTDTALAEMLKARPEGESKTAAGVEASARRAIESILDQHAMRVATCIRGSFDYLAHRFPAVPRGGLVLAGDLTLTPGLAAKLAPRVGADVSHIACPCAGLEHEPDAHAAFASALGAALGSARRGQFVHAPQAVRVKSGAAA